MTRTGAEPVNNNTPNGAENTAPPKASAPQQSGASTPRKWRFPKITLPAVKKPKLGIRRFAKKKIHEQLKGDPLTPGRAVEEFFKLIGFEGVVNAWKHPTHRTTKVLTSVFNKAADMMAGRAVNMSIRLIAITTLTGFLGGSVWMTMGLTALATGAGSALYAYHRNYLNDRLRGPKDQRKDVKYFCRNRLRQACFVFLGSAASGAFGAWLGKTEFMQSIVKSIKGVVHNVLSTLRSGVDTGAGAVQSVIAPSAPAAIAPSAPAAVAPPASTPLPPAGSLQKAFDGAVAPGRAPAVSVPVTSVPVPAYSPAIK